MIKMVATDIDGTIFEWGKGFSPAVVECMKKLKNAGVKVVLVTGRMHRSALHVAKELNLGTPVISYQGALIKDCENKTLFEKTLSVEYTKQLIKWARDNDVHINLYLNDNLYVEQDNEIIKCYECGLSNVFDMIQKGEINDAKTICALSRAFCKGYQV